MPESRKKLAGSAGVPRGTKLKVDGENAPDGYSRVTDGTLRQGDRILVHGKWHLADKYAGADISAVMAPVARWSPSKRKPRGEAKVLQQEAGQLRAELEKRGGPVKASMTLKGLVIQCEGSPAQVAESMKAASSFLGAICGGMMA